MKNNEIISNIEKALHRYNSASYQVNGKKMVSSLTCQIKFITPDLSVERYWLVILWWLVCYRQEDTATKKGRNGRVLYVCRKTKAINWRFKEEQEEKARELFRLIIEYTKTTNYPRKRLGDKIYP